MAVYSRTCALALSVMAFVIASVACSNTTTLKFVTVLYRHGDRTPIDRFPNDRYHESDWPQGFGQLTKLGMVHERQLGQLLRERYAGFLNTTYVRQEIYVRSSDVDRTLMSAQAVVNGLYPTPDNQQFQDGLSWQPIPVHTMPIDQDHVFNWATCSSLAAWKAKFMASETVQSSVLPYKDRLIKLHEDAGYTDYDFTTDPFGQCGRLRDTLLVELLSSKVVPEWYKGEVSTYLDELYILKEYLTSRDDLPLKLRGGTMLYQFLHDMQAFVQGEDEALSKRKMMMYSGHDSNVLAVSEALRVYPNKTSGYSSMLILELHQSQTSDQYFVNVFARFDWSKNLQQLTVPGCSEDCPLDQLLQLTADVLNPDPVSSCQVFNVLDINMYTSQLSATILLSVILAESFLLLVTFCCCWRRRCRRKRVNYAYLKEPPPHNNHSEFVPMISPGDGFSDED